jgi:hypothetical protein
MIEKNMNMMYNAHNRRRIAPEECRSLSSFLALGFLHNSIPIVGDTAMRYVKTTGRKISNGDNQLTVDG